MPPKTKEKIVEQSFEAALQELEVLTESMENNQLSLTDLLKAYERGNQQLKHCGKALEGAKEKIELIQAKSAASNDDSTDSTSEEQPNDQDVRLF